MHAIENEATLKHFSGSFSEMFHHTIAKNPNESFKLGTKKTNVSISKKRKNSSLSSVKKVTLSRFCSHTKEDKESEKKSE